jgi:hypothetical protein
MNKFSSDKMSEEDLLKDLYKDLDFLRSLKGVIFVSTLEYLDQNTQKIKTIFSLSRLAGRRLFIFVNGKVSEWTRRLRDFLADNIDVSIQIYEYKNISEVINMIPELCEKDRLLISVRKDLAEEIIRKGLRCRKIIYLY